MWRRIALSLAIVAALALVTGCGSSGNSSQGTDGTEAASRPTTSVEGDSNSKDGLAVGCSLSDVHDLLAATLTDINEGRRSAVANRMAPQPELTALTIYHEGERPEDPFVANTPQAASAGLLRLIAEEGDISLLRATVGAVGPFAPEQKKAAPGTRTAGAEFVFAVGSSFASGKVGIDCTEGTFYEWVMNVSPDLRKIRMCGDLVKPSPGRPVICRSP